MDILRLGTRFSTDDRVPPLVEEQWAAAVAVEHALRGAVERAPGKFRVCAYVRDNTPPALQKVLLPHCIGAVLGYASPALQWTRLVCRGLPKHQGAEVRAFFRDLCVTLAASVPDDDLRDELDELSAAYGGRAAGEPFRVLYGGKTWVLPGLYALVRVVHACDRQLLAHFPTCVVATPSAHAAVHGLTNDEWTALLEGIPDVPVEEAPEAVQGFCRAVFSATDPPTRPIAQFLTRMLPDWPHQWTGQRFTCARAVVRRLRAWTPPANKRAFVWQLMRQWDRAAT
jgi:hypothetical protein